jgi:hypothetical protein
MSDEMIVSFPGGKRVDASFEGFTVETDQSEKNGGAGAAPEPFELFLASLATCAGIYVLSFCQNRNIPTDGVRLMQQARRRLGVLEHGSDLGSGPPSRDHVGLHLDHGYGAFGPVAAFVENRAVGILPALILQPASFRAQIFDEAVAVGIAKTLDPVQRLADRGP